MKSRVAVWQRSLLTGEITTIPKMWSQRNGCPPEGVKLASQ